MIIMSIVRVVFWGKGIAVLQQIVDNWYKYDSFPVLIITICTFIIFLNINITNENVGKYITTIAPATFGVYLIHAHAELSPWIWETLALPDKMNNVMFPIVQFVCVCLIFVGCIVLDLVRSVLFRRIEQGKAGNHLCDFITEKFNEKVIGR